jgi:hypothetical protein
VANHTLVAITTLAGKGAHLRPRVSRTEVAISAIVLVPARDAPQIPVPSSAKKARLVISEQRIVVVERVLLDLDPGHDADVRVPIVVVVAEVVVAVSGAHEQVDHQGADINHCARHILGVLVAGEEDR